MTQERIKITKYEDNPEWNLLEINDKWTQWTISSYSDGNVEIESWDKREGINKHLFLNQEELKQVIEFLQSKVK